MKTLFVCISLLCSSTMLFAQQNLISLTERKNEIGLAARNTFQSGTHYAGLELTGKRWKSKWQAFRFSLGFNQETTKSPGSAFFIKNDSIFEHRYQTTKEYGFLGLGFEAERQFIGKLYLYGAIDTRFMLGKGHIDAFTVVHPNPGAEYVPVENNNNFIRGMRLFKWDLLPSIGAKIKLNRICFGLEACTHVLSYEHQRATTSNLTNSSLFDFDLLGNFSNRIVVTYRF